MANTKRLISRDDAAKMLGCTPQTISNWVSSGLIKGRHIKGCLFIDSATITAYFDTYEDVAHSGEEIHRLQLEYASKEKELKDAVREKLKELRLWGFHSAESVNRHLLNEFVEIHDGLLTEFEIAMLQAFIKMGADKNTDIDSLADAFGMTGSGIVFRCRKAIRKLSVAKRYGSIVANNKELMNRIERLEIENKALKEKVGYSDEDPEYNEEIYTHMRELLDTKIISLDLSVRAINCLKSEDIETLGDLVSWQKLELLQIRNFGKKTLTEIEQLVNEKNLVFGMNVQKYYKQQKQ